MNLKIHPLVIHLMKNFITVLILLFAVLAEAQRPIDVSLVGAAWSDPSTNVEVVQNGNVLATYDAVGTYTVSVDCGLPIELSTNGDMTLFGNLDSVKACIDVCKSFLAFDCPSGSTCSHITSCSVLPLEWVSFSGRNIGNSIQLEWEIASAVNVSHFIVEKSSLIGKIDFKPIGEVILTSASRYKFDDKSGIGGYYRIKELDLDGLYEFSKVVYVPAGQYSQTQLTTFNIVTGELSHPTDIDNSTIIGSKSSDKYGLLYLTK